MIALLLLLSVAGWVAILTRGAGPWGILTVLRVAWPDGPLGCPLCCGTWVGALVVGVGLAPETFGWRDLAAWVLTVVVGAGSGAIVSDAYAKTWELVGEAAYLARQVADSYEAAAAARAAAREKEAQA